MIRVVKTTLITASIPLAFLTACDNNDSVSEEVGEAVRETGDAIEDKLEDNNPVDEAGEAIQDAAEEAKN